MPYSLVAPILSMPVFIGRIPIIDGEDLHSHEFVPIESLFIDCIHDSSPYGFHVGWIESIESLSLKSVSPFWTVIDVYRATIEKIPMMCGY